MVVVAVWHLQRGRCDASATLSRMAHVRPRAVPSGRTRQVCKARSTMTVHDRPFGRYLEDFVPGDVYRHWPGKTITEYDDHLFCMITMNHHPLHTNVWFAENETRARQQRGRRQPRVLAGARHERARRLGRGDRQPRDRDAAAQEPDLPRRHDLRRDPRARQRASPPRATAASSPSRRRASTSTASRSATSAQGDGLEAPTPRRSGSVPTATRSGTTEPG